MTTAGMIVARCRFSHGSFAGAEDSCSSMAREARPQQLKITMRTTARRPFSHSVLACALVVGAFGCEAPYDVQELSYDLSIGYLGTFNFYEPKADSARMNRPAFLAIHGGGFRDGDKPWADQFAKEFCPHGYVVFSINSRLAGRPNGA